MRVDSEKVLKMHLQHQGKLSIEPTLEVHNHEQLSEVYTPGVAEVCKEITQNPENKNLYTMSGRTVAVITDGSAVLGLGNIGAAAALPVMEGKCLLFKNCSNLDAYPIALNTQNTAEIIDTIRILAPNFAAINLEDISAPRCFEVESQLQQMLDIPVIHDDQHATSIAVLAGLKSALHLTQKKSINIVVQGAGAAGSALVKLLTTVQVLKDLQIQDIKVYDTKGLISIARTDLEPHKEELAQLSNQRQDVLLEKALEDADLFIGLSTGNTLDRTQVESMPSPIIFALANPEPEIMPDEAKSAGASIVATGRSDFPNQINNALIFPGLIKGMMTAKLKRLTPELKTLIAEKVFQYHLPKLDTDNLLPDILDKNLHDRIAATIATLSLR